MNDQKFEKIPARCSICFFCDKQFSQPLCRFNPPVVIPTTSLSACTSSKIITNQPKFRFEATFPPCPPDDLGCGRFYPRQWGERDLKIVEKIQ